MSGPAFEGAYGQDIFNFYEQIQFRTALAQSTTFTGEAWDYGWAGGQHNRYDFVNGSAVRKTVFAIYEGGGGESFSYDLTGGGEASGTDWMEWVHTSLDAVGIFDPFGIVDGTNALLYMARGDYLSAGISAAGIIPYVGDVAKIGKYGAKVTKAAKGGTHSVYRVVSKSEAADVLANGFRQAPISSKISAYEGKLFWSNVSDANWFKSWKGADDVILKIKVNNSFIYENGYDAGRLFYYVSPDRLGAFNSAIKVIK